MTRVEGCRIDRLDGSECRSWLDWITGRGPEPEALPAPAWALCYCDDGLTWGIYENGSWRLASAFFPQICPVPSEANLQEIRIFCRDREVLAWRTEDGLRGRIARDDAGEDESSKPLDECRVLLWGRVLAESGGFTRVRDRGGEEQVLPIRMAEGSEAPRLRIRNYFARDEETGCVRIAVTRFVEVSPR